MSNSYRIRTKVGVDKSIKLLLDQEFEYLEILSLKILQSQIYTRQCADYGVVVGRVFANGGFGVPNAKVSIFIPLKTEDEDNPIINELYPYKTINTLNEDGYRYNLLPYVKSYSEHAPTGTFFTREDVLKDPTIIEVFDKYYKYTARTNDSGDFMIFGVPTGEQTLHIDIDLSDIGEFSLSPQDLIRMGVATEAQVAGTKFKTSANLDELPQILTFNKTIEVEPLWGQNEICTLGITRTDFDLTNEANITITPTAIFMGSIFSDTDRMALKTNCKPRLKQGELCNLVTGPGEILAIRQTIQQDINGRPGLETIDLEAGGQVIDENGTWLLDVPMNLDYVTTNEFGEKVISNDPKIGVPTRGKYRFKVKWNQSPSLSENTKRGYFLIPNIREYGWGGSSLTNPTLQEKSYAFSLDWNDYADPQSAILCEDTFYDMRYNKVYSVSQLIDQHRRGSLPNRFVSVKNILDDNCESENNRFPTNDSVFRIDIIYLLLLFVLVVLRPIFYALVPIIHSVYVLIVLLKILLPLFAGYFLANAINEGISAGLAFPAVGLALPFIAKALAWALLSVATIKIWLELLKLKLNPINLPVLLYDLCEFCNCENPQTVSDEGYESGVNSAAQSSSSTSNVVKIPTPNASGIQVTDFTFGFYNNDLGSYVGSAKSQLSAGEQFKSPASNRTKIPLLQEKRDADNFLWYLLSTSLTVPERINLFNTKAKFFNGSPSNPGGGVNVIQTSFDISSSGSTFVPNATNGGNTHFDNIVFLMTTPDSLSNISAGDIITFQNPSLSTDRNLTGATENEFGNNAITGTSAGFNPVTTIQSITPNGSTFTVNYTLPPPNSADTNYHKYPTDIEYFQVVTAMTYSNFNSLCVNQYGGNLNERFLKGDSQFLLIRGQTANSSNPLTFKNTHEALYTEKPFLNFENYGNQTCLFLVRGVDPYSTRQCVTYYMGRIFGYNNYDAIKISGNFKLNRPIVGGLKNVKHLLTNNTDTDSYSNSKLYFDTFSYQPSNQFSAFTSTLPYYYSILDNDSGNNLYLSSLTLRQDFNRGIKINDGFSILNTQYDSFARVQNSFGVFFPGNTLSPINLGFGNYYVKVYTLNTSSSYGYFNGEVVEGASAMGGRIDLSRYSEENLPSVQGEYYSYIYQNSVGTNVVTYPVNAGTNRKLVMRSDRLPASTKNFDNGNQRYLLQQNGNLGIYKISDDGVVGQTFTDAASNVGLTNDSSLTGGLNNPLINSLNNCSDSVPLKCYEYDPVTFEFKVKTGNDCKSSDYDSSVTIWNKGCYKLITKIILSIPTDFMLLTEWLTRINITFAACRNVFSHTFTNNWINGTLYAFAFKQNRVFNNNNQPIGSDYCEQGVYLHPTNNFYYRSAPYFSSSTEQYFVSESVGGSGVQKGNLKYPTTLIDLGPRSYYLQEIIMSDDYDGYVVNKLNPTTFGDVSDLLNIFILSRIANSGFIGQIFGSDGANIFNYFKERTSLQVDGDYAQMISINSEIGVNEFESENYPDVSGPGPIYFSNGNSKDGVFGIFFKSDNQVRDYITPKRTIVSSGNTPLLDCTFSYFNVFTQKVPFYQWKSNPNSSGNSIFGSQSNTWFTQPSIGGNQYFSNFYQKMDRVSNGSRYFRTNSGNNNESYNKAFIWGWTPNQLDASPGSAVYPPSGNGEFTVGAPFHFYFGLKKGKSAWDRFAKKWIGFENITD